MEPFGLGKCAKQTVQCTLVTPDGQRFVGRNWCLNPQEKCPRLPGEGYEKCKLICHQVGHAEETAVIQAGDKAKGATAYIEGHTYACDNCQSVLLKAGVVAIHIAPPPTK